MRRISMILISILAACQTPTDCVAQALGGGDSTSRTLPSPEQSLPLFETVADATKVRSVHVQRQFDSAIEGLLRQYRGASSTDREPIAERLRKVLAEQFEDRQAVREQEIARLAEEVKRLAEIHDRRNEESERIVSDRLQQLLREAEGLGWGGDAVSSRRFSGTLPGGASVNPDLLKSDLLPSFTPVPDFGLNRNANTLGSDDRLRPTLPPVYREGTDNDRQ